MTETNTVPETAAPRRHAILAAEDNPAHRHVLRRVMAAATGSANPVDLDFVGDGHALMAALDAGARPDLVLLDMHMPGMGGRETVAAIRRDARHRMLPVVMLSSSAERHHVEAAYENGANAYMVKRGEYPVLLKQMRHFVEFWLDTARLPG